MRCPIFIVILVIFAGVYKINGLEFKYVAVIYNHPEGSDVPLPLTKENVLLEKFKKMMTRKYPKLIDDSVTTIMDGYEFIAYDPYAQTLSELPVQLVGINNTVISHTSDDDNVYLAMGERPNCTAYDNALKNYISGDKYALKMKRFAPLFKNLSREFHQNISNFNDIHRIYVSFRMHIYYNITLNSGTKNINPEEFYEAACYGMSIPTDSEKLARIKSGPMLKEIISRMHEVNMSVTQVKMDLYRTDEFGIVAILNSLNMYENRCPQNFATIFIEIFKSENVATEGYYVKISYRNDMEVDVLANIPIPNCGTYCPLDKFIVLYKNVIPLDWDAECNVVDDMDRTKFFDIIIMIYVLLACFGVLMAYYHVVFSYYPREIKDAEIIVPTLLEVTNNAQNAEQV